MKRLYAKYGKDFVLLDATYRTSKYALPLFFLVVRTNVCYQVAAVFICQQETKSSIQEALTIIRGWSPEVQPKYGMVDFCEEEIAALEEVYPGTQTIFEIFSIIYERMMTYYIV